MTDDVKENIANAGRSAITGGGISFGSASLWPETVHGFAVLITGVLTAVVVFFVNKWLKRKFPD